MSIPDYVNIETEFLKLSWQDRYKYIIELAKSLPSLNEDDRIKSNMVSGCQSQVWLTCKLVSDKLHFKADSDALIVKGLIVIVLSIYDKKTPTEILKLKDEFIKKLGLNKYLTQTRTGGMAAIIKQIKFYALGYQSKMQKNLD